MKQWIAITAALLVGCTQQQSNPDAGTPTTPDASNPAAWMLRGSDEERFTRVARHLRGLDVAMIEIGHRYNELYWAGVDQNWKYAAYQAEKIGLSLDNAIERRPKRGASAAMFQSPLKATLDATKGADALQFKAAFEGLTATCNACHAAEKVEFMYVAPPTVRMSLIRAAPPLERDGG